MQLDHERNLKLDAFERVEELQRTVSTSILGNQTYVVVFCCSGCCILFEQSD